MERANVPGKDQAARGEVQHQEGRLRAFVGGNEDGTICGGCRATLTRRHRVVELPCGHRNVLRARFGVISARRGGAQGRFSAAQEDA